ncbi:MAG TPA: two-component regulator propeller domain-containing protein [Acidobacteriaceae bacterium]|jgi:ligand-binding sensor domain-containing protein/signal transduction histidine kinase|nr:two-component regulator propeller domain-containing protein [Acidobacteriaceae bacterium]
MSVSPFITRVCRRARIAALLCLCAQLPFPLFGLNVAQFQYTQHVWHVQDGLPEETVQALQQTPDGYLWIGTTGGLARFDGTRFITYSRNTSPGITENSVFCLLAASDGTLWLGTEGGGLLHLVDGVFHAYNTRQGLTDSFVRSILQDRAGQLWVGTDNGLFRMRGTAAMERMDTSQFTPSLAVHSIYEDRQHRVWVGGSRLLMFDGGRVQEFRLRGEYSQNRVKTILQTADGTIWVGTVSGLQRLRNGSFQSVPGIAATVRTLRQTSDGRLWIGTIGHGLFTWAHGQLSQVNGNGLLPSKTVLSITEDNTHQIWIGTQDGLVRLSRTAVGLVRLPGGSDPDFETLSEDTDGTIWAVSSRVYAIRHDLATAQSFRVIGNTPVRNIFRDRQGGLWIGTDGSGAYRLSASGAVHYSAPERLANNFVRGFLESRDGSIWIATDEGISRIADRHIRNFRVSDGLVYFSTRSMMEDRSGRLWIGTDQGLSCWDGDRFVQNEATRALNKEKIWSILQDTNGVIWFGTRDHGLFRYRSGKIRQFTAADGLAGNSVYQLLEDHLGQLWISSPNTITSIPISALDADASSRSAELAVTTYDMPYDADGAQMYGGRQPSGCIGKDGSIWFPSSKGAIHISPELAPRPDAPKVQLISLAVDGRELLPADFKSLSADASRLEIAYAPLSLRSQEETRFRYRLDPFDRDWTYAGTNRVASYTNLPAGQYRFRVVAFPLDNPSSTSEVSLSFRRLPHFYATWWFISGCVLILALAALLVYRRRVRLLQIRFRAVLDERSRLAREMHDTVIQGCTSISALLEAIASLERENEVLRGELLTFARTQLRTTIDEARQAVWNLRHGEEPLQDLTTPAAVLAEHTSREFGIPVECRSTGTAFAVRSSVAHEVSMVIREAVYNAVLHGRPSRVTIDLTYGTEDLQVSISDDGCGFAPASVASDGRLHYGLAGMRERIERLDGNIEWLTAPGRGTTVRFRIRRIALFPAREGIEL